MRHALITNHLLHQARDATIADGLWPATPYIHAAAKEEAMTSEEMSRMTTIARRSGPMWRHAGGRNPTSAPAESEHELTVLSRHRTSEGVVTYARCSCGELQIWLTGAGRPAHTLITSIPGRSDRPHDTGNGHLAGLRVGRSPETEERSIPWVYQTLQSLPVAIRPRTPRSARPHSSGSPG